MRRKIISGIGIAGCVVVCILGVLFAYNQVAWHSSDQPPAALAQRASAYEAEAEGSVTSAQSYSCGSASCMPVLETSVIDIPGDTMVNWSFTAGLLTSWDSGDKPLFTPQPVLEELTLELNLSSDELRLYDALWQGAGKNAYRRTFNDMELEKTHGKIDVRMVMWDSAGEEPISGEGTVTATGILRCGGCALQFSMTQAFHYNANV